MLVQAFLIVGFLLMVINLVTALQLRGRAPGGIIGSRLLQLIFFIGAFAAGYLVVGYLVWFQPKDTIVLILSLILAFGAIFVFLVLRLVASIVKALGV